MDVGRGDVDPQLDPERAAERELLLEAPGRQEVDVVARECVDVAHGAAILRPGRIAPNDVGAAMGRLKRG